MDLGVLVGGEPHSVRTIGKHEAAPLAGKQARYEKIGFFITARAVVTMDSAGAVAT